MNILNSTGDQLRRLISSESGPLLIVSPFITRPAFDLLLNILEPHTDLTVITRWHPLEIAAGASDPSIYDIVYNGTPNRRLLLFDRLHVKAYRRGGTVLVGSANATLPGLGWASRSNAEVLVSQSSSNKELAELIEAIATMSQEATEAIRRNVSIEADRYDRDQVRITEAFEQHVTGDECALEDSNTESSTWIPRTTEPARLHDVYARTGIGLLQSTIIDAVYDLSILKLPADLSRDEFTKQVAERLQESKIMSHFNSAISADNEEPEDFLKRSLSVDNDESREIYQRLTKWVFYFLKSQYRRTSRNGKLKIIKRQEL